MTVEASLMRRMFRPQHWFFGPLSGNAKIYGQTALAAAVVNVLGLFSSFFIMTVYDRVIPNNAIESLVALTIGVMMAHVFDFCLKSMRGYFVDVAGQKLDAQVGARLFDRLIAMRLDARKAGVGATANLVRDFDNLKDFFSSATLVALVDLPFILVFVAVIALIGGPVAILPAGAALIALAVGLLLQPVAVRHMRSSMRDGQSKHAVLIETLAGLETVKSVAADGLMRRRWREGLLAQAKTTTLTRFLNQFAVNFTAFCQQAAQVGVVVVGVLLVGDAQLTMGGLIACVILTGRAMAPLAQVGGLLGRISGAISSYRALDELMATPGDVDPDRSYLRRKALLGRIEFRDVSFSYPNSGARALDDVSFSIEPGERVAILGRNGSGKSSLVRLMTGVYEPSEGRVLVDDTDLRQIAPSDLRANIGVALQDVVLFSGTVKENIALGLEGVSDERILAASRSAGVHDFIGATDAGYDMKLGERGEGLSGGQRQAIALARALAADPSILVLDEPSSSLDSQSEAKLVQRLRKATEGRTLLLVTHRLSMLTLVDRIIVLDGGRIVVDGRRDEIMRAMATQQAAGARPRPVARPITAETIAPSLSGQPTSAARADAVVAAKAAANRKPEAGIVACAAAAARGPLAVDVDRRKLEAEIQRLRTFRRKEAADPAATGEPALGPRATDGEVARAPETSAPAARRSGDGAMGAKQASVEEVAAAKLARRMKAAIR